MHHSRLLRYLPHALLATFGVAVVPAMLLILLQFSGVLRSPLLSVLLGIVMSSAFAHAGSAWWMRRPQSQDLVFGDLLLWGFVKRIRTERRLSDSAALLGIARGEGRAEAGALLPKRRTEALRSLGTALEARDPYTHGHSQRVVRHTEIMAKKLNLQKEVVAKIRTAAAVHDVGKLKVPREVLNKPARLTDEEFALMKRHPVDSAEMAAGTGDEEMIAMVRHHHERLDGKGYPSGLRGAEIPLGSRIIAVADTFDALTSSRPYRPARKHKEAIEILKKEGGTQLDPEAVEAFLSYYGARRSVRWWGLLVTAPQRLVELFGVAVQGAGGVSVAQGVATVAAAAVLGSAVAAHSEKPSSDHRASAEAASAQIAAHVGRVLPSRSTTAGNAPNPHAGREGAPARRGPGPSNSPAGSGETGPDASPQHGGGSTGTSDGNPGHGGSSDDSPSGSGSTGPAEESAPARRAPALPEPGRGSVPSVPDTRAPDRTGGGAPASQPTSQPAAPAAPADNGGPKKP